MVLAIRGSSSYEDLVTDLIDRPVDITDWVPEELKQVYLVTFAVASRKP